MDGKLSLYGYAFCPFCARVMREIKRLGIEVEMVDTLRNPDARQQLVQKLGRGTVPVLRIEDEEVEGGARWMPESADIIEYLRTRFEPR
ncbi:MAG: glutaredoxin [Myxococcota bacterium]